MTDNAAAKDKNPETYTAVNNGRVCLGWFIALSKASFKATSADGRSLGTFRTKAEAIAAIWASAGHTHGDLK
jgi:hypothetical protein